MRRNLLSIGLLVCVLCVILQAQTPIVPKAPFTAADLELGKKLSARSQELRREITGNRQAGPFKIIGDLYFAGSAIGEHVFLLTSPQGHILLGTGYEKDQLDVEKNIQTLGFKMTDIKIVVAPHWHPDQAGGAAYLKQKTGATLYAGIADIPFIENGGDIPSGTAIPRGPDTPAAENAQQIPAVKVDRALFDGDGIKLGPWGVTTYNIPGHTPGSMSFVYTVRDGNRDFKVFEFCCGQNYPNDVGKNPNFSEAAVRHSAETFRKILPIDIYLGGTDSSGWITDHLAKIKAGDKMALVDRTIFPAFTALREVEFEEKFSKSNRFK